MSEDHSPVGAPKPPTAVTAADLPSGAESSPSFWELVKESISGSRRDFTREPIGRSVILLAVPMVLEMMMESVFVVVDIFWVSKLGAHAIATVGLTESMLTIVYAVAVGLSMGATAVVARRIGEGKPDAAARAAVQAILIGVVLAAGIGVVGAAAGPQLLEWMGASPETIAMGGYTRIMLGGSITVVLLFLINAVFRGAGDASVAMRSLWLANAINIVLGPFLVFGWGPFPQLGVEGAAIATTIGRGTGVLYQLKCLFRRGGRITVRREHFGIEGEALRTILRISRTGIFQVAVATTSWVALVRILSEFGSIAVAGYTIAIRVILFALLPSWGMANAAATLVGQNLGANLPARAEASVWRAALYNLIFLGVVGFLFVLLAEPIVRLFTSEAEVVLHGSRCLRIVAAGFVFYAYGMVVGQAFNGAGDTRTPTWLNFGCFWLLEIPAAYLFGHLLGFGPTGIFCSITLAFCVYAIASVVLFRRGRWKTVKV